MYGRQSHDNDNNDDDDDNADDVVGCRVSTPVLASERSVTWLGYDVTCRPADMSPALSYTVRQ